MTAYDISTGQYGRTSAVTATVAKAIDSFARYRRYRTTLAELTALNDSDLRDLGLGDSDLKEVARNAAWAN